MAFHSTKHVFTCIVMLTRSARDSSVFTGVTIDFVNVSKPDILIGASLSEPHASKTALRQCVCMLVCLRPYTVNFK